jgi:glutathione synthase/RimK-type ligase-like ATP-grasp enzyme
MKPNLTTLDQLLATPCISDIDLYGIDLIYLYELARYYSVEVNKIPSGEYIVISNDNVKLSLHAFNK